MKIRVVFLSIICVAAVGAMPFLRFERTEEKSQNSAVVVSLGHISNIRGAGGFLTRRALEFTKLYPEVYIMVRSVSEAQIEESDAFDMVSFLSIAAIKDKLLSYTGRLNISSNYLSGGSSGANLYGVAWIKSGETVQYFGIINPKKQAYAIAFIEYVTGDSVQAKLDEIKAESVV